MTQGLDVYGNLCEMWHHIECEDIKENIYDILLENEEQSLHWYCKICNVVAGKIVNSVITTDSKYKELEAKVSALEENTVQWKNSMRSNRN